MRATTSTWRGAGRLRGAALVLGALALQAGGAAANECRTAETRDGAVEMDPTWAGTTVGYAALERGGIVYFGYYDAERRLTVASLDPRSRRLCVRTLDAVFGGWDSHNGIVMAFDSGGRLHVAGNMHGTGLIYARASEPDDVASLRPAGMVGTDEARVTYPRFVRGDDGNLLFVYRSGASGRGEWIVNRWADGRWARVSAQPVFAASWQGRPVSAYPSPFVADERGVFHVAIVWRHTGDAATNFAVSYAATRDFQTWRGADGRRLTAPLTPDTADPIERRGEGQGLLNAPIAAADERGQPMVAYTRYGPGGNNAVFLAKPEGSGWTTHLLVESDRRVPIEGTGTLPDVPRLRELDPDEGTILVAFPGRAAFRYGFDPVTFEPRGSAVRARAADSRPSPARPIPGLGRSALRRVPVLDAASGQRLPGRFEFFAQAGNGDRPVACTADAPKACDPPPSPVYFVRSGH